MAKQLPTKIYFDQLPEKVEPKVMSVQREGKQARFLAAVGPLGWVRACEDAEATEESVVRWLRMFPEFRALYDATKAETADRLERVVDAIAVGERDATPVQVTMLQFRLKALKPDVYRERASVQVDQRTTLSSDLGEGGRARLLLAEWQA